MHAVHVRLLWECADTLKFVTAFAFTSKCKFALSCMPWIQICHVHLNIIMDLFHFKMSQAQAHTIVFTSN